MGLRAHFLFFTTEGSGRVNGSNAQCPSNGAPSATQRFSKFFCVVVSVRFESAGGIWSSAFVV